MEAVPGSGRGHWQGSETPPPSAVSEDVHHAPACGLRSCFNHSKCALGNDADVTATPRPHCHGQHSSSTTRDPGTAALGTTHASLRGHHPPPDLPTSKLSRRSSTVANPLSAVPWGAAQSPGAELSCVDVHSTHGRFAAAHESAGSA